MLDSTRSTLMRWSSRITRNHWFEYFKIDTLIKLTNVKFFKEHLDSSKKLESMHCFELELVGIVDNVPEFG